MRILLLLCAAAMVGAGTLFALQGLGYLDGSPMTGSSTWAVLGPLLAGLGVALAIVVLQRRER